MSFGNSVGVVGYGGGNTGSVARALDRLGADVTLASKPDELGTVSRVVIPGVGSFKNAMLTLRDSGWIELLQTHVNAGKPLAGICLGMQLLMDSGEEGGGHSGLALIAGSVSSMKVNQGDKLPHMGWNDISVSQSHKLLEGVRPGSDYYFAHSYVVRPSDPDAIVATTTYGEQFASIIASDNVVGFQFHPEKSPPMGRVLLANFLKWNP